MQHGEEYGGGVYSSPPIPQDYGGNYFGSPPYGSIPPSAPSAPDYGQAAPQMTQTSYASNPSASGYNSQANPSYSYVASGPHPSLVDFSPSATSHSSYPPLAPSYAGVGSPYDRLFNAGVGPAPSSADNLDTIGLHQDRTYGGASQRSLGYDSHGSGMESNSGRAADQGYGGYVYDQGPAYENAGYGLSDFGYYGNSGGQEKSYDSEAYSDVFAYDGGNVEPYGSRGTGGDSWSSSRNRVSGSYNSGGGGRLGSSTKIARATPKADGDSDSGGIQRFRVKLLPEFRSTDPIKDVICQIGLDGVRMVDPNTQRTLRIYPLDTIDKWEVKEPSVFTFWAKSPVDIDQRIIQLKSSNTTTTAILDTLTAACVQLLEIGKGGPSGGGASTNADIASDPAGVRKGSVLDWMAIRPRPLPAEEKQHWMPDEAVTKCTFCGSEFGAFLRRHHCRNCGDIFCDKCTRGRIALNTDEDAQPVRVCDRCLAEVTHRLENGTRVPTKVSAPQRTHEDLAKKLQEEMERTQAGRRSTSAASSGRDGGSQQTSVLHCTKCGSVTLVTGSSSRCSNCGFEDSSRNSGLQKEGNSFRTPSDTIRPHSWSSESTASTKAGPRMREVACPTCTVHLQVQVPDYGTETVECGICQHPFLVSA